MSSKHSLSPETGRLLFRHLAAAARKQAPLAEVLHILAQDNQAPRRQAALLRQLAEHLRAHAILSDALACMPHTFAHATIALVRHAEQSNCLPEVLEAMASDEQRRQQHQAATRAALVWPLTILLVLAVLALLVLIFVLPAFKSVFASFGADLPPMTLSLLEFADFLTSGGWVLLALIATLLLPRRLNRLPPAVSGTVWRIYFVVPVVRNFFFRAFGARLANWLHALHADRAGLAAAVSHVGATSDIALLRHASASLAQGLAQHTPLSATLQSIRAVPQGLALAARLGENAGDPTAALALGLELADEQATYAAHRLGRWLFYASYLFVGLLVWWFVTAMYLPIFKLGSVV